MAPNAARQSLTAAWRIVSNTGSTFVGELEIARKISRVAVRSSKASLRARCKSVYDAVGAPNSGPSLKGPPHVRQNFAWGGLSCWHRGHFIAEPPVERAGRKSRATVARGSGARQCACISQDRENVTVPVNCRLAPALVAAGPLDAGAALRPRRPLPAGAAAGLARASGAASSAALDAGVAQMARRIAHTR
jgi:hypothetical protein